MGEISTQDFLLEAARHLEIGYFDLVEDVFGGIRNLEKPIYMYDDLLERVTPKFAELLNITEDEYYKLLYVTGCDEAHCSNCRGTFGLDNTVTRFVFSDAVDIAKNKSLYQIKNDGERDRFPREEESVQNAIRLIDMIGCSCRTLGVTKDDKEYAVSLNGAYGIEAIMLYLYKHTQPHQKFYKWGPVVKDLYRYSEVLVNIWDDESDVYFPATNFISQTEYYSYGEINPALVDLLEKEWDSVVLK